jgi:hypothetical protein
MPNYYAKQLQTPSAHTPVSTDRAEPQIDSTINVPADQPEIVISQETYGNANRIIITVEENQPYEVTIKFKSTGKPKR